MCDAEAWCDAEDNPVAVELWNSDRPVRLEVLCRPGRCRLAVVYDSSLNESVMICLPRFDALADEYELGNVRHNFTKRIHFHADAFLLTDDEASGHMYLRCRCGKFSVTRAQIKSGLKHPNGRTKKNRAFIFAEYNLSTRNRHEWK